LIDGVASAAGAVLMVNQQKIKARMRQNFGVVRRTGQQKAAEHPLTVQEFPLQKVITGHR
jgi:hypothetical protein